MTQFEQRMRQTAIDVEATLETVLGIDHPDNRAIPPRLLAAMRYGVFNGGKRLRPVLLIESAALFGAKGQAVMRAAAALECVHCYSLIHDDLPAMDDDDLRRGKPTVHKAFDEATAILAGDALLTLAFEILAHHQSDIAPAVQSQLVILLARAAGASGMIGGQMLDIEAESLAPDEARILALQAMKTGALLCYACEAGALLGGASETGLTTIRSYGTIIGLAFQLADDLLDVTSDSATLGKATGKDAGLNKATLVARIGVEQSRVRLQGLLAEAEAALDQLDRDTSQLRDLARFVIHRTH